MPWFVEVDFLAYVSQTFAWLENGSMSSESSMSSLDGSHTGSTLSPFSGSQSMPAISMGYPESGTFPQ